jgi:hypothetical protein
MALGRATQSLALRSLVPNISRVRLEGRRGIESFGHRIEREAGEFDSRLHKRSNEGYVNVRRQRGRKGAA